MKDISFMYHDVYNDSSEIEVQKVKRDIYKIKKTTFEQHISYFADFLAKNNMTSEKILFTFDDGFESFHSVIAPVLENYGFRGFFFIPTAIIGNKGFLKKDQILDLHKRGHKIGTHTHTHPKRLSDLNQEELYTEWKLSQSILEEITHQKIIYASIPGGYFSKKTEDTLLKIGIEAIFTSIPTKKIQYISPNCKLIGRYVILATDNTVKVFNYVHPLSFSCFYSKIKFAILSLLKILLADKYLILRRHYLNR